MSKRPSAIKHKECKNSTNSSNSYGYVIIGDSAAAILYAQRLIKNGVTSDIDIIIEGLDRTNEGSVECIEFPVTKTKRILHYLKGEQIHLIEHGDETCEDDDDYTEENQIYRYHVGHGVQGDMIGAYFTPYVGPWFSHSTANRLEHFVHEHTEKSELNDVEKEIADKIVDNLNIGKTNNLITKEPSMLYKHYRMVREHHGCEKRELFLKEYDFVNRQSNVHIHLEVRGIKFEDGSTSGLYNVSADSGLDNDLIDRKVIFKANPFTRLRVSEEGGLSVKCDSMPVVYRAVLSIPQNNSPTGADLSGLTPSKDLITTHLAFSVHDLKMSKNCSSEWLAQTYTTSEDLSVVNCNGVYADTDNTLLIVEAVDLKNKRKLEFNTCDREIQMHYNSRNMEAEHRRKFAEIVAGVYNAYTGNVITVDELLTDSSICTQRVCTDKKIITDVIKRETPITTVLELTSHLYSNDLYNAHCKC